MTSDVTDIESLIPHAGKMVLIERVTAWDDNAITCRTGSHRRADNPLRNDDGLPVTAAIEYGGQAAAVHGGLTGQNRAGMIVAVRDLVTGTDFLDRIGADLIIRASCLASNAQSTVYTFTVSEDGGGETAALAQGRLTIALDAAA